MSAPATITGARSGSSPATCRRASSGSPASSAVSRATSPRVSTSVCASAASWPTVPATPIALPTASSGSSSRTAVHAAASSTAVGGSLGRWRSVDPDRADLEAGRERLSRELGRAATDVQQQRPGSSAPTPRRVSRASSSPESRLVLNPYDHSISPRNASPFSASRTALVATASVRSAPSASSSCRKPVSTLRTRATGTGSRRRLASTPSPRRVTTLRREHRVDPARVDVGNEETGRVRTEVDRRDARHLRGTVLRSPSTDRLNSDAARPQDGQAGQRALQVLGGGGQPFGMAGEPECLCLRVRGGGRQALRGRAGGAAGTP